MASLEMQNRRLIELTEASYYHYSLIFTITMVLFIHNSFCILNSKKTKNFGAWGCTKGSYFIWAILIYLQKENLLAFCFIMLIPTIKTEVL